MCGNMGSGGSASGGGSLSINSSSLPKLQGSEKQVAWANDIRNNYIADLNDRITNGDIDYWDIESMYYNGLGIYLTSNASDRLAYDKQLSKIKAQNPDLTPKEQRLKAEEYPREIYQKAVEARKSAKAKAKSEGKTTEQIKLEGNKAYVKAIAPTYKQWTEDALNGNIAKVASQWIEKFKNSKYNTFYKK
jgi:hypothetical protein